MRRRASGSARHFSRRAAVAQPGIRVAIDDVMHPQGSGGNERRGRDRTARRRVVQSTIQSGSSTFGLQSAPGADADMPQDGLPGRSPAVAQRKGRQAAR